MMHIKGERKTHEDCLTEQFMWCFQLGESSSEAHRGHEIAEATFIVSLIISECLLLAISVYLLLLGNNLYRIIAALLLAAFFAIAVIIYKNATAEEKEEEQYAVSSKN